MRVRWNRKTTTEFIMLYHVHECLWNLKHPSYQVRTLREEALEEICNQMGRIIDGITVRDLKVKIHVLRTQYRRALIENAPYIWCFELLDFLRPMMKDLVIDVSTIKHKPAIHRISGQKNESPSVPGTTSLAAMPSAKQRSINVEFRHALKELETTIALSSVRRFHWLGEQAVSTLNEMKNEEIVDETIEMIQRVLMKFKKKDRKFTAESIQNSHSSKDSSKTAEAVYY